MHDRQAIEVTQNEGLKRSLNDLLETLPGGGIVQVLIICDFIVLPAEPYHIVFCSIT